MELNRCQTKHDQGCGLCGYKSPDCCCKLHNTTNTNTHMHVSSAWGFHEAVQLFIELNKLQVIHPQMQNICFIMMCFSMTQPLYRYIIITMLTFYPFSIQTLFRNVFINFPCFSSSFIVFLCIYFQSSAFVFLSVFDICDLLADLSPACLFLSLHFHYFPKVLKKHIMCFFLLAFRSCAEWQI